MRRGAVNYFALIVLCGLLLPACGGDRASALNVAGIGRTSVAADKGSDTPVATVNARLDPSAYRRMIAAAQGVAASMSDSGMAETTCAVAISPDAMTQCQSALTTALRSVSQEGEAFVTSLQRIQLAEGQCQRWIGSLASAITGYLTALRSLSHDAQEGNAVDEAWVELDEWRDTEVPAAFNRVQNNCRA